MTLKTNSILLIILILISVIGTSARSNEYDIQSEHRTLIVGSEQNFPPFSTGMTDSTAGGFTVDFWKTVAAEAGLNYTIRVLPFRQLLEDFKQGRIDVLINLAISDERRQFADFSVPHVIVDGAIFVRKNTTEIESEDDLSGHSVIVLNADLAHDYAISKGWTKHLVLVDTIAEGLTLLASGKHDAMLLSKLVGMQSLKTLGLTNIKPLKTPAGFSQKFAFAIPKGHADLLSQINEAMAITNSNGIYTALYDKWFGIYQDKGLSLHEISLYISPLIAIFSIIAAYFYYQRRIERKQAQDKLKLAASVFTHAGEGILITDAASNIIEVNETFTKITGYSREEIIGQNPRILQSGRQSSVVDATMWQAINTTGNWTGEVWNRRKDGEVYAETLTMSAVRDDAGNVSNYVALFSDITQITAHQNQLERMANYDVLTNLPNRALLADRLQQAMLHSQCHHNSLAVVFLDLDDFKDVNDNHGHAVGDELLIILSLRMKGTLSEEDTLARIGGDEFVAILANLDKFEDCQPVLERLLLAASKPITVGDIVLRMSVSIGVTTYPQDGADADILMRHADQAMYGAKQAGKNRYHLFDTAQYNAVKSQRESIGNISSAFDRREFVLYYQPKVNMATGEVIGVEALIRWQHPVMGLIPPVDFLPIIENHAVSLTLGEWVIDTALFQISQWQKMGITLPISVNISAYQLQQVDFVASLARLLDAHPDVSPSDIELEVLETSALSDINQVTQTMLACRALGVKFALDDFGTGYSSLTYLRRLPAKWIKIDQSFVYGMLEDPNDLAIVEGVIVLAKSFKRDVIAEGVETIQHGTALLQLGCELAQGYGIARPMSADDIPTWLNVWKPNDTWRNTDVK